MFDYIWKQVFLTLIGKTKYRRKFKDASEKSNLCTLSFHSEMVAKSSESLDELCLVSCSSWCSLSPLFLITTVMDVLTEGVRDGSLMELSHAHDLVCVNIMRQVMEKNFIYFIYNLFHAD